MTWGECFEFTFAAIGIFCIGVSILLVFTGAVFISMCNHSELVIMDSGISILRTGFDMAMNRMQKEHNAK